MPNPIFSIITPTYNRANLLKRCGESILNQSFGDFEWIIIDDGSIDNTKEVINSFKDPRIVFFSFSQNQGVNVARNKGLDLAKGKYLFYVDSDDLLLPDALEIIYNIWQKVPSEVGCVITRCLDADTKEKLDILQKRKCI